MYWQPREFRHWFVYRLCDRIDLDGAQLRQDALRLPNLEEAVTDTHIWNALEQMVQYLIERDIVLPNLIERGFPKRQGEVSEYNTVSLFLALGLRMLVHGNPKLAKIEPSDLGANPFAAHFLLSVIGGAFLECAGIPNRRFDRAYRERGLLFFRSRQHLPNRYGTVLQ